MNIITCVSLSFALMHAKAFDNYFTLNPQSVTANTSWGYICFGYNEYIPTCGWTLALSANLNLTNVTADGVRSLRQAPHIFQLINTECNANLSSKPKDACLRVTLYAQFNNVKPSVYAGWRFVCNSSTAGVQKGVTYHTLSVGDNYPTNETGYITTGVVPPTQAYVLGVCPTAKMSSWASLQYIGNVRYIGQHTVDVPNTYSTTGCSMVCLNSPMCVAVNYVTALKLCQVITEDDDVYPGLLSNGSGCSYYVVSKRV